MGGKKRVKLKKKLQMDSKATREYKKMGRMKGFTKTCMYTSSKVNINRDKDKECKYII